MSINKFIKFRKLWKYTKAIFNKTDYKYDYEIKARNDILNCLKCAILVPAICCLYDFADGEIRIIFQFKNYLLNQNIHLTCVVLDRIRMIQMDIYSGKEGNKIKEIRI